MLRCAHPTATLLLTCMKLAVCEAATTNNFIIGGGSESPVGEQFSARFSVPSKAEASARLESFKALGRRVTVREFLGGDIQIVQIVFYGDPIDSFERAKALLRDLLASHILAPERLGAPTLDGLTWAEGSRATIRATVGFGDGRIGRLESDLTDDGSLRAGGVHLFLEDHAGTYWWHRWDAAFPRESEEAPANQPVEATQPRPEISHDQ
jgi:hypothetical protein